MKIIALTEEHMTAVRGPVAWFPEWWKDDGKDALRREVYHCYLSTALLCSCHNKKIQREKRKG